MSWRIRQHREITGSLYSLCQASLVLSTGSTPSSRHNFTLIRNITRQHRSIFVVNFYLPLTKWAYGRSGDEIPCTSCSSRVSQVSSLLHFSQRANPQAQAPLLQEVTLELFCRGRLPDLQTLQDWYASVHLALPNCENVTSLQRKLVFL